MSCLNTGCDRAERNHAIAAAWGAAEATAWFIVPDVWLSAVALRRPRHALRCVGSATLGALVGGAATYAWARRVPAEHSASALTRLPAISPRMVERVGVETATRGVRAVVTGPLRGTPYKLYARAAAVQGVPLVSFLAWSIPARVPRFALVTGGIGGLAALHRRLRPRVPEAFRVAVFLAGWTAFYAWYFRTVGRSTPPRMPR